MDQPIALPQLPDELFDPDWRLNNLYKISDKDGNEVVYTENKVQSDLSKRAGNRVLVLKSRQQGVSTKYEIEGLDSVLWNNNYWVCVIAHHQKTLDILFSKIQFAWDKLDPELKQICGEPKSDNRHELYWRERNSRIYVALEVLGGTNQIVHFSEYALIDEKRISNTLPTVPPNGRVIKESTPFGTGNKFYRDYVAAKSGDTDEQAFFYEWWWSDEYRLPIRTVKEENLSVIERSLIDTHKLDFEQIEWRRREWKNQVQPDGSNLFPQVYPEDDISCFMASTDSVFDTDTVHSRLNYVRRNTKSFLVGVIIEKNGRVKFVEDERGPWKIYEAPKRELSYCLPDGELVVTSEGWKTVETVTEDDHLIDADGKLVRPLKVMRHQYNGTIYGIRPSNTTRLSWFTDEHPIMVLKDTKLYRQYGSSLREEKRYRKLDVEWKDAKDVKKGDIVRFPLRFTDEMSKADLTSFFGTQATVRVDRAIKPDVINDPDFWFFIGLWLGDGWVYLGKKEVAGKKNRYYEYSKERPICKITIAFNKKGESESLNRLNSLVKKLFNRKLVKRERESTIEASFDCEAVYWFLRDNFGQKATNKNIPEWGKSIPRQCKLELIRGFWWSDGCCVRDNQNKYDLFRFVSISEELLHDVQDLLISLGLLPSVSKLRDAKVTAIAGKVCRVKKAYSLGLGAWDSTKLFELLEEKTNNQLSFPKRKRASCWIEEDYIYFRVKEVRNKQYTGQVNNFETVTHTFCTPFITTHNCAGVDVSIGGPKSDDQVVKILKRGGYRDMVATYCNRTEIGIFAQEAALGCKFYNLANICPERNSIGEAFIEHLLMKYPNHLIYRQENRAQTGSKSRVQRYGYNTTRGRNIGKQRLVTLIQDWLRDDGLDWDEATLEQMLAYQRLDLISPSEGYKMGASAGNKDDRVIALGLALEMDSVLPIFKPKMDLLKNMWDSEFNKKRGSMQQQPTTWMV